MSDGRVTSQQRTNAFLRTKINSSVGVPQPYEGMRPDEGATEAIVYASTGLLGIYVLLAGNLLSQAFGLPLFSFLGWTLASICVIAGLTMTEFSLAITDSPPAATLAHLASELRRTDPRVAEEAGELRIHLGRTAVVRILVRRAGAGCKAAYRMDLTPTGIGILLFLFIFGSLAVVPFVVALFVTVRRYAVRRVAPLLRAGAPLSEPLSGDEGRGDLVKGLEEAHRLVAEACEIERSAYSDAQAVVFLTSLVVFASALYAGIFITTPLGLLDLGTSWKLALTAAVAASVLFGVGMGLWVRRRFQARFLRFIISRNTLHAAMSRGVLPGFPAVPERSLAGLLMEASKAAPEWLDAVSRSGLSRDPSLIFPLLTLAVSAIFLVPATATSVLTGNPVLALFFGLTGTGLFVVSTLRFSRMRHQRGIERVAGITEWNRRFDEMRSRMNQVPGEGIGW